MARNPWQSLLRLRQMAVDEAQRGLAAAYRREAETAEMVQDAHHHLAEEMRHARRLETGDEVVEAFARWLPTARRRIAEAMDLQQQAAITLEQRRATVMLARRSLAVAESAIEEQKRAITRRADAASQAEADAFALQRFTAVDRR